MEANKRGLQAQGLSWELVAASLVAARPCWISVSFCEPVAHLQSQTGKATLQSRRHRNLRAEFSILRRRPWCGQVAEESQRQGPPLGINASCGSQAELGREISLKKFKCCVVLVATILVVVMVTAVAVLPLCHHRHSTSRDRAVEIAVEVVVRGGGGG